MRVNRKSDLFTHLFLFVRKLKVKGLKITPANVVDAFRSIDQIDLSNRQDFKKALQTNFVSSKDEVTVFNEIFGYFWDRFCELTPKIFFDTKEDPEDHTDIKKVSLVTPFHDKTLPPTERIVKKSISMSYSPHEAFLVKDFSEYSLEDQKNFSKEAAILISRLAMKVSRRRKHFIKGNEIDFRRTIRRTIRSGGDVIELIKRQRKIKPIKIIFLCDVSGSMDASTRFILQFIFGLQKAFSRSEAFVFSTRLTRITDVIRKFQMSTALNHIERRVPDWSGGTRLGFCLKTFNNIWGKRMAVGSSLFILFSDGWDRGDPAILEAEVKRMKIRAYKIIWINPFSGTPGFQPLTRGMQTVLPYIDHLLPANNLKSIRRLCEVLAHQLI